MFFASSPNYSGKKNRCRTGGDQWSTGMIHGLEAE